MENLLPDFLSDTHEEWNEPVVPVELNGLLELVPAQTQLVVALDVADLHQPDQAGLLHRGVGLKVESKEIGFKRRI